MEAEACAGVVGEKGVGSSAGTCAFAAGLSCSGSILRVMGKSERMGPIAIRVAVICIGLVKPCLVTHACMALFSSGVRLLLLAMR